MKSAIACLLIALAVHCPAAPEDDLIKEIGEAYKTSVDHYLEARKSPQDPSLNADKVIEAAIEERFSKLNSDMKPAKVPGVGPAGEAINKAGDSKARHAEENLNRLQAAKDSGNKEELRKQAILSLEEDLEYARYHVVNYIEMVLYEETKSNGPSASRDGMAKKALEYWAIKHQLDLLKNNAAPEAGK